jgi:hypothetical protein
MACCAPQSLQSFAWLPAGSVPGERHFADGGSAWGRSVLNRPAAKPRFGFWRWLLRWHAGLPRLEPEYLSEHRLRDLGFIDGRAVQPRDPLRD